MAQSLAKGLRILFLFTGNDEAMTVKRIADGVRVPLPTAYRLVRVLAQHGLLEKSERPGHYQLGGALLEFSGGFRQRLNIATVAKPRVEKLARISGETVQLTMRNGDHGTCILVKESRSTLRVAPEMGRVLPLHAGASVQVLLAFLPDDERRHLVEGPLTSFTPHTLTVSDKLWRRLQRIKRRGFAVTRGEVYPGAMGIAAPIFDATGRVIASLAVSGPILRMAQKQTAITEATTALAREISQVMGWAADARPGNRLNGDAVLRRGTLDP
jgi:IclR family acetate operon transcriptional repressor